MTRRVLRWGVCVALVGFVLAWPVHGQDLTTQLSLFLRDLRAGTLGVTQPITSETLTTLNGTTGTTMHVKAATTQTLNLGNADGEPLSIGSGSFAITGTMTLGGAFVTYVSPTAPTISSGFGTSPSIQSSNGTSSFRVNVGTGGVATSGVIGMPAATTGWNCQVTDSGPGAIVATRETASTTTTVTVGAASAWAASDILIFNCSGF